MKPIDKSNLLFSLNNNNNCTVLEESIPKRIVFAEHGLLSKNKEIIVLLTDKCFPFDSENEVYGHVIKDFEHQWCSCLIYTHKRLNKYLKQNDFLSEYYKKIIVAGNWSPMNSISTDDVFIKSHSYPQAIENMCKIIKNFTREHHIPVSPDPEDEINKIATVQKGYCDFRILNLYGINLI